MDKEQMTIGPFAKCIGASIAGVRRWCEIGLLRPERIGKVRVFGDREIKAVEEWRQRKAGRRAR